MEIERTSDKFVLTEVGAHRNGGGLCSEVHVFTIGPVRTTHNRTFDVGDAEVDQFDVPRLYDVPNLFWDSQGAALFFLDSEAKKTEQKLEDLKSQLIDESEVKKTEQKLKDLEDLRAILRAKRPYCDESEYEEDQEGYLESPAAAL